MSDPRSVEPLDPFTPSEPAGQNQARPGRTLLLRGLVVLVLALDLVLQAYGILLNFAHIFGYRMNLTQKVLLFLPVAVIPLLLHPSRKLRLVGCGVFFGRGLQSIPICGSRLLSLVLFTGIAANPEWVAINLVLISLYTAGFWIVYRICRQELAQVTMPTAPAEPRDPWSTAVPSDSPDLIRKHRILHARTLIWLMAAPVYQLVLRDVDILVTRYTSVQKMFLIFFVAQIGIAVATGVGLMSKHKIRRILAIGTCCFFSGLLAIQLTTEVLSVSHQSFYQSVGIWVPEPGLNAVLKIAFYCVLVVLIPMSLFAARRLLNEELKNPTSGPADPRPNTSADDDGLTPSHWDEVPRK